MYMGGIDPTNVWASTETPSWGVGDVVFNKTAAGVKGYMFVKDSGSGITGDGYLVNVDGAAFTAVMITTANSAPGTGTGKIVGVARAAIAASGYGWIQIWGAGTVRVLASCAAYTRINTTATAGALDDDATVGARVINNIVLSTANGGATANTAGWIQWPYVAVTL